MIKATQASMTSEIQKVYLLLKSRAVHPSGKFDGAGRWHASNSEIVNVRSPSRAYPYSEMTHCRTKKYVKNVQEHFECRTLSELLAAI